MKIGKKVKKVNQMTFIIANIDQNINLIMELSLLDNGKEIIVMDKEHKFGLTEQSMKATGKITKHMVKELSGMFMVMFIRAIGKEIKLMEKVNILIKMAQHTMATGKMIYNMDKE
jgi:hypothetical protein